jgi:hypothetical protein
MSTCLVTFDTGTLTGVALPGARLVFQSTDAPIRPVGVRIAPSERHEVTANSLGQGSIVLAWGNWTVTMISTLGQQTVGFAVPQAASGRLEQFIAGPVISTAFTTIQLAVLAAGGRGLFETPAAGRAATVNGDIFLAPLAGSGVGIYRRDSAGSSPQIGSFFTGEVTVGPADATAGRLLKVGDFGIGATGINFNSPTCNDLDDVNLPAGTYNVLTATTNVGSRPSGANENATMQVIRYNIAACWQIYYNRASAAGGIQIWIRGTSSAGTWSSWRRIYDAASVIGTASHVGGLPTGAIFERASNANGFYTRFADGTQICGHSVNASSAGPVTWTYPALFLGAPIVQITAASAASAVGVLFVADTATAIFNAFNASGTAITVGCRLLAVGRWF